MAIRFTPAKSFTPASPGVHSAVVCEAVDLGPVKNIWLPGPEFVNKVKIIWQTEEKDPETGKPITVSRTYTNSQHPKSSLRKDLEALRGRPFTKDELQAIATLCQKWDAMAISDEIYEHIIYDGQQHVPIATIQGMADRTITINGLSKTYSVTGWRVGWTISPPAVTGAIRKVHDFLTVGAPAPLQAAGAVALGLPDDYYTTMAAGYERRRDMLLDILARHHFTCYKPLGAYYIMTDISTFGFKDDVEFVRYLIKDIGVAGVPGSSFYKDASKGRTQLRFCFCKKDATLLADDERLAKLVPTTAGARRT